MYRRYIYRKTFSSPIEKIIMHTSGRSHVVLCAVDGMDRNER